MINPLYKIKNWKLICLNDLLEEEEKQVDLSIFDKFIEKYWNRILEKQPLWFYEIDKIYFLYPYSLGYRYPKTNIVKYFQIAKTWSEKYCKLIFDFIKDKVLDFAKRYDAVVFVPWSVDRKCNVLDYLKEYLEKNWLKIIPSFRVKEWNEIKNIRILKEKFRVANEKFEIWDIFDNITKILIIDDMVNTGASMCAIANKLKKKYKNLKIDWLAIVGSLTEEMISDI